MSLKQCVFLTLFCFIFISFRIQTSQAREITRNVENKMKNSFMEKLAVRRLRRSLPEGEVARRQGENLDDIAVRRILKKLFPTSKNSPLDNCISLYMHVHVHKSVGHAITYCMG